jgi:hypothetical protein
MSQTWVDTGAIEIVNAGGGMELEPKHKVVCFDTDPLKTHFSWRLWQDGKRPAQRWEGDNPPSVTAGPESIDMPQRGFTFRHRSMGQRVSGAVYASTSSAPLNRHFTPLFGQLAPW